MKESIIIKNFGPIKDVEISDIRPMTILIGESGSGKSTILKVLALFRWIYKMVSIRSYLKQSGITKSPFRFSFNTYLRNNGFENYIKGNSEITYSNGTCVIEFKNGKLVTNEVLDGSQLSLEKICFISDKRNLIPDIISNNTEKKSTSFFLRETLDDFLLSVKEIKELNIDYLGVRLITKKTSNGEKYYIESTDSENQYSIKLEDASSGTQTVTPMMLITEYYSTKYDLIKSINKAIFSYLTNNDNLSDFKAVTNIGGISHKRVNLLIEEPELSLYPESQRSLINGLVKKCFVNKPSDYNMTIMLATHSPYILNHINLLIKAGEKGLLEEGAQLHYNDVDLFEVADGYINNLKIKNSTVIDTRSLSEPISNIYSRYNEINKL